MIMSRSDAANARRTRRPRATSTHIIGHRPRHAPEWLSVASPYVELMRPHHWGKNVLVAAGAGWAGWMHPEAISAAIVPGIVGGLLAICLVASSNYVLNGILDAPYDRWHPGKQRRPLVVGRVQARHAYVAWFLLAAAGIGAAAWVNVWFLTGAATFLALGLLYNIPPARLKDVTYLDVICEGVNSPLRILLGWWIIVPGSLPNPPLIAAAWTAGAALMARKRLQEYRLLADPARAEAYRKSFGGYNERRLSASVWTYVAATGILAMAAIVTPFD